MVVAKKFILIKNFDGLPKESDFKLVEEELPALNDNEFLSEAVCFSVDPYMRAYANIHALGKPFMGRQVARIIESKSKDYPVGKYVVAYFPWQTHTIFNNTAPKEGFDSVFPPRVLPYLRGLPSSLALGVLGMPGDTAYFGFLEICQPKQGEVVVVSGAAGAVGSHVGQIAKIKGCTVIGIAGDDEKGNWITKELGFDYFINYKTDNVAEKLQELAKDGIDCYFDNVGGEISSIVISQMRDYGRISVCGAITTYNDGTENVSKSTAIQGYMVSKQLKMEGFVVTRWANRTEESFKHNIQWIKEGKLKYRETITEGFENMSKAFISMLQGGNTGKAIIKV